MTCRPSIPVVAHPRAARKASLAFAKWLHLSGLLGRVPIKHRHFRKTYPRATILTKGLTR
jgi:hypothetical protein